MITLNSIPIRDEQVTGKVITTEPPGKTEAVLVLPSQGKVEVLNEVGARIWELVDGNRQVSQIVEIICAEYQVELSQAEADTLEFLTELVKKQAIKLMDIPAT